MSDSIHDIAKSFEENVLRRGDPKEFGLFPIPEYPEFEADQGMWSAAFDAILTTLRYLAPATLLTLFWGQQSFLFKILKAIDTAFRSIVYSSEEQKQEILQWLAEAGPVRVEHLDTVWRHGWILCGVLDAALPGACKGHPPTRLSLKHAQTIADHYLGIEPVFSRQELESNDSLSRHQEWKLSTYIDRIRKALDKLTPPVSKPTSQRTSPDTSQVTFDYVARGSGLAAALLNNKTTFKLYPTSQQSVDPAEITILIRGPKDTYGMTVIPPILGKAQLIRQKLLGLQQKTTYTETALPLTQGATYMRTFGKNDMNKTYHIPKTSYDIEIEVEQQEDYAKVSYTVNLEGKYEISITSRGQNIVGSPFAITSSKNIIGTLENESFCLEDGEEINIVDVKSDRKVILRIVDFVTEKMLLRENGTFEKLTEEEAKILMSMEYTSSETSDMESRTCSVASTRSDDFNQKHDKFNKAATKVVQMNRVCKIINSLLAEKRKREKAFIRPLSQQSIPDIVNSTLNDGNINPFLISEKRDKFIVPENISVSLRTEKAKPYQDKEMHALVEEGKIALNSSIEINTPDSLEKYESIPEQPEDDILTGIPNSSSNPFLNATYEQNYNIEKDLGSFVKTEYETNKSANEETEGATIKILVEAIDSTTPSPINVTNPFAEPDIIITERPKTPVLKIITGEVKNREDSVFVDPKTEDLFDEMLANEFVNPFFIHHHQQNKDLVPVTDFIIGAPVSLPPIIRAATPEPNMDSIIITDNIKNETKENEGVNDELSSSVFSTPLHTNVNKFKESQKVDNTSSSPFYSLDSIGTDNVEILSLSNSSDNQVESYQQLETERDVTSKKDTWDSAYVSIDESNGSPDSNNNDNNPINENSYKQKFSLSDIDYINMGPAEREIWETCNTINETKVYEEAKPKWDTKRPIFTPILEESDRSVSTGLKDATQSESGSNSVAFAELNYKHQDFFPNDGRSSPATDKHMNCIIERNDSSVNSASVPSDVKRHAEKSEGKISEVQANVTESVSVSQTLHNFENEHLKYTDRNKDETQFGDENKTNIVLEKKQYWDERIREIQAKSTEDDKTQQRKRRLSARHLRQNDSLTKRRGKQVAKNFLSTGGQWESKEKAEIKNIEIVNRKSPISQSSPDKIPDVKLVEKWKNYWDNRLHSDKEETDTTCFKTKSPKSKESSVSPQLLQYSNSSDDLIEKYNEPINNKNKASTMPVKQELSEEVFKAFETSPKRFFGTSRKQILNKIDTFLGKPGTADESSPEVSGASNEYDTGLVSSRISLFHTISKTEELPWVRRKCQSMHNIFQRKDSERSIQSVKEDEVSITDNSINRKKVGLERKYVTIDSEEIKKHSEKSTENTALKEKRARLVQNINNKSFDEYSNKNLSQWHNTAAMQTNSVKKTIKEYNQQSEHRQKYYSGNVLRKSAVSKSEMDIFNKMTNKSVEDDLDKYKSCDELPKINVKSFISLYESVSKEAQKPERKMSLTRGTCLQKMSLNSSSTGAVNNISSTNNTRTFVKPTSETDESTTEQSPINRWNKDHDSISSGSYEPRSLDSVDVEIISLKDIAKNTTYVSLSDIELEIVDNAEKPNEISQEKEEASEVSSTDYKSRFKMAKQFFQSLEDVTEIKKPKKLNECEMLLLSESSESLENEKQPIRPPRRVKKYIKSHSMPSSELSKIWIQLKESQDDANKLVKISEKFNVDDLFNDVMEGKLSRQGSLRGIPHKKAVLEAFRSMENLTDKNISSYEIAASQLTDFAKENHIKNAQTYLTEYPYLPTTAPSKYHSRLDAKATGLISLKEIYNQKPRRNSVPDLRLNPSFTVEL